jgi:cell volume regulation protein A
MVLGYISKAIFKLSKIPEILILMILGLILVPIGHILPISYTLILTSLAPLFGSIALVVILLGGSKEIHPKGKYTKSMEGVIFGLLDILLSAALLAWIMNLIFGWPFIYGALLGTIVGETTTIIVIDIIKRIRIPFATYDIFIMESTTNSVVSIIIFSILLLLINNNALNLNILSTYIVDFLSIGVFFGLVFGFAWLFFLNIFKSTKEYLAILAIALLLYGITSVFNGAAIVAVFIFGLIVGNHKSIGKLLKIPSQINETEINITQKDIEFLLRTFFFVFIGMIAVLSLQYFEYAIFITLILILIRYIEVLIFFRKDEKEYRPIAFSLLPRGTTAAVLSTILFALGGFYYNEIFYLVFMVILITNIIASIALAYSSPKIKK